MPRSRYLINLLIFFALIGLTTASGCARSVERSTGLCPACRFICEECERPDGFVRLRVAAAEFDESSPPFSHPLTLSREEWKRILGSIRIQEQDETFALFPSAKHPVRGAFREEEIDYLSGALKQAFDAAQPHEWVAFGLKRRRSPEITELTTGGWFLKGRVLHFLLGNYHFAATMPTVEESVWQHPLQRQVAVYGLVADENQTVRHGWQTRLWGLSPEELSFDYRTVLENSVPTPQSPSVEPSAETKGPVQERLRTLKHLYDDGLITEEEYRMKKKELLDRL